MREQALNERRPSECARQGQVPFGRLFDTVNKFGRPKPTLLSFDFAVVCRPPDFAAKLLEITLALLPLSLLYRVTKLATREFVPQSLHRGQVGGGDILDIGEIDKVATLCFGPRDFHERVSCKLWWQKEMG